MEKDQEVFNGRDCTRGEGSHREKYNAGNFEISIHHKKLVSPTDMLEKFYALKEDEKMSNEEKSRRVRQIIQDYME